MSAVLWTDLDEVIAAQAEAVLGLTGSYTTLELEHVLLDDVWNYDALKRDGLLPALLIKSDTATEAPGAHGGGVRHVDINYRYEVVAVCVSSGKAQARADAKELRLRLVEFLRTPTVLAAIAGTVASNGERVSKINYGQSATRIFGRADIDAGEYIAVAGLSFTVDTTL